MGDDSFGVTNVRYAVMGEDGTYCDPVELGDAVSFDFTPPDDELERWADVLVGLRSNGSFELRLQWWSVNRLCKVLRTRAPYTVRRLRRGGKSHRGRR